MHEYAEKQATWDDKANTGDNDHSREPDIPTTIHCAKLMMSKCTSTSPICLQTLDLPATRHQINTDHLTRRVSLLR